MRTVYKITFLIVIILIFSYTVINIIKFNGNVIEPNENVTITGQYNIFIQQRGVKNAPVFIEDYLNKTIIKQFSITNITIDKPPFSFVFNPNTCSILVNSNFVIGEIDKNSNVIWRLDGHYHHAFDIYDNKIYAQFHQNYTYNDTLYRIDNIGIIENGILIKNISVINALIKKYGADYVLKKPFEFHELSSYGTVDLTHLNQVFMIKKDYSPVLKRGYLLLSLRTQNKLIILNPEKEEIVWDYEDSVETTHSPSVLENGNILFVDNGIMRKWTRIVEIDPITKKVVWEYTNKTLLNTRVMGSAQRLTNGNTFITSTQNSKIFEVNSAGEIVYMMPNTSNDEVITKTFERVVRLTGEDIKNCN